MHQHGISRVVAIDSLQEFMENKRYDKTKEIRNHRQVRDRDELGIISHTSGLGTSSGLGEIVALRTGISFAQTGLLWTCFEGATGT